MRDSMKVSTEPRHRPFVEPRKDSPLPRDFTPLGGLGRQADQARELWNTADKGRDPCRHVDTRELRPLQMHQVRRPTSNRARKRHSSWHKFVARGKLDADAAGLDIIVCP